MLYPLTDLVNRLPPYFVETEAGDAIYNQYIALCATEINRLAAGEYGDIKGFASAEAEFQVNAKKLRDVMLQHGFGERDAWILVERSIMHSEWIYACLGPLLEKSVAMRAEGGKDQGSLDLR